MIPDDKNKYDTILKHLTALFPKEFAQEFCPMYHGEEVSLFSESLSISERTMDRVICIDNPEKALFHSEFEKSQAEMSKRAFEYFALTYIKYGKVSLTVVMFLEGKEKDGWRNYELNLGDICVANFKYYAIYLSTYDYKKYLEKNVALTPLVLLMDVPEDVRKDVFEACVNKINKTSAGETRDELLAMTIAMADLQWETPDWTDAFVNRSLLRRNKMITEMIAEAEKKGREEEREEGIKKELKAIKTILEKRFGSIPEKVLSGMHEIHDLDKMCNLLVVAATAQNIDEFSQAVGND